MVPMTKYRKIQLFIENNKATVTTIQKLKSQLSPTKTKHFSLYTIKNRLHLQAK